MFRRHLQDFEFYLSLMKQFDSVPKAQKLIFGFLEIKTVHWKYE